MYVLDISVEKLYTCFMEKYEYKQSFRVSHRDADFKDELKISSSLAYMEQVAADSAEELGFGYTYLKPKGYAFMLCNLYCEFLQPVRFGDELTLSTWPTPPSHVIFGREYTARSADGLRGFNASSRWCLADLTTGKLLPSKTIENQEYSTYNTERSIEGVVWRIPTCSVEEADLRFSIKIANSEYDRNMHVNNTKYADYCLNCFSVAELNEKRLKSFAISYVKQCREGDFLRFFRKEISPDCYCVQGLNERNEVVALAKVVFDGSDL